MNSDLIERLAREAGGCPISDVLVEEFDSAVGFAPEQLSRFAALVAEACARECDAQRYNVTIKHSDPAQSDAAIAAACAIRRKFKP